MASGAAALTLKTAVVIAVLAVLALPSLGRCPSLGPEPAPAPAPAPGPPIPCDDCQSACQSACSSVPVVPKCIEYCDHSGYCNPCQYRGGNQCEDDCSRDCSATCVISCDDLQNQCRAKCHSNCSVWTDVCSEYCNGVLTCDQCKKEDIKQCEADCCSNGTCGTCNCDRVADEPCPDGCLSLDCRACMIRSSLQCDTSCKNYCNATVATCV